MAKPGHRPVVLVAAIILLAVAAFLLRPRPHVADQPRPAAATSNPDDSPGGQAAVPVARRIVALTGARTRLVWARYRAGEPNVNLSKINAAHFKIMAWDTDEAAPRELVADTTWPHCSISPLGTQVLYFQAGKARVVDFDGKNDRALAAAEFVSGWAEDPPGRQWAYFVDGGKLVRCPLDDPTAREVVWDKTPVSADWSLSRDGKEAVSAFPWPAVCLCQLPDKQLKIIGHGCGWGMAWDGSCIFHKINGHRGVMIYDGNGAGGHYVDLSRTAPGVDGREIQFPRMAKYDAHVFTLTGPEAASGTAANVIMGRFDAKYVSVVNWVQVTDNNPADGHGDAGAEAWIAPREK